MNNINQFKKEELLSSNNSFLKTILSSEINNIITKNQKKQDDYEEIYIKYIDLKKKINIILNKIE
jgi:hypothetical protein